MRLWVYHQTKEPVVIEDSEKQEYLDNGWAETPAAFKGVLDKFGAETPEDVQYVGENIEAVKNMANDALNIKRMTKNELEAFAMENFGVDIDKRKSKSRLQKQVEKLIAGDK